MRRLKNKSPEVIVCGHLCLDIFPKFLNKPGKKIVDLLRPGTLVQVGAITFSTGGPVSNTGIALKKFGCNVGFIAKVGDDIIGKLIIHLLANKGNAKGINISKRENSSYTIVIAPAGIDRIFLHCPGTNDTFSLKDIDFNFVSKAKLFHLGYPTLMASLFNNSGKELEMIYRKVKEFDLTTSMDISLPDPDSPAGMADWRSIYKRTLPYVDIFTPSIEEAFFTLDRKEYLKRKNLHAGEELLDHISLEEFRYIAKQFLDMGCAIVALKTGYNGWYLKTSNLKRIAKMGKVTPSNIKDWENIEYWAPAFKCEKIVNTTGAGDNSIAAFLTAFMKGMSPHECLRMANCAGYMNVQSIDAVSGLVRWEELIKKVNKLIPRKVSIIENSGWKWDKKLQVWHP